MNKVKTEGPVIILPSKVKVQFKCEEDANMLTYWLNYNSALLEEFENTMMAMWTEAMRDD